MNARGPGFDVFYAPGAGHNQLPVTHCIYRNILLRRWCSHKNNNSYHSLGWLETVLPLLTHYF